MLLDLQNIFKMERKDHLENSFDGKKPNNTNEVEHENLMAENINQFSVKRKLRINHKPMIWKIVKSQTPDSLTPLPIINSK